MHLAPLVLAGTLVAGAAAQTCIRPIPPTDGFSTQVELAVPVSYSDSYTTFGSMQLPDVPAPSCGWPLVVYVHQLGANRFDDLPFQSLLAAQGFAVWSYDVRGQGQAIAANPGHANAGTTLWGPIERHDLAEQVAFVAANPLWAGIVDAARVAVVGKSQGGAHAWQAAAWSGQPLQTPGRAPLPFPTVACVVAHDLVADAIDDWLREGELFSSWWIEAISGSYQGVPFDPVFLQTARAGFLAQDPAGLAATLAAEGREVGALLAASAVPVLYGHAYLDSVNGPISGFERLESMPASTRAVLGTVGHGVPGNLLEDETRANLALRWLHRFLWEMPNEVDTETPHVLSLLPLAASDRDDPAYAWSRAHVAEVNTPGSAERFFLHDDFELRDTAPTTAQTQPAIEQVIDPTSTTFNVSDYLDQPSVRDLANVLTDCPLAEQVWSMQIVGESEMARSAELHLRVVPDEPAWMLAALLTLEPAGGDEVLLSSRAIASRDSVAGVAEEFDLRLPPIATRLPADSVLRLRLRNLWVREFPMTQGLEVAPMFSDFRVEIVPGGAPDGSWLDLPIAPVAPRLVVDRFTLSLATPDPATATIRGGEVRAGYPYFAMVGLSGQVPMIPYLNGFIPIDGDWLVVASGGSTGTPYYQGFLGFLDAAGEATCVLDYSSVGPLPQGLNGLQLTLASYVWDGPFAPTGAASNPCDIMLR